jgi:hypothetical protein
MSKRRKSDNYGAHTVGGDILIKIQTMRGIGRNKHRQPRWKRGLHMGTLFHPDGVAKITCKTVKINPGTYRPSRVYILYLGNRELNEWEEVGRYDSVVEAKAACGETIGPELKVKGKRDPKEAA